MRSPTLNRTLFAAAAFLSAGAALLGLFALLSQDAEVDIAMNLPGGDGRPEDLAADGQAIDLSGEFQEFNGVPSDLPGAWPRFRGADYDNICKESVPLAESWGAEGPPVLWRVALGEGHAAPAVLDGRVYVLDYDEENRRDAIRCFSLDDGQEIWRRSYPVVVKRNHGMSRTIPAVTDNLLVTIGPRCHVVCMDPKTGAFKWGVPLVADFGTEEPLWYTGQCPLIDDGKVILAPGGPDALLVALDGETGERVWTTPNPHGWTMSHSSVMPMTFAGTRMFVYCAIGGVVAVAAEGEDAGSILWETPWNAKVLAPSPVQLDDGKVFLTAGYGHGSMMVRIRKESGAFAAEVLFEHSPKEWLACEQQTPIYVNGLLHAIMPKDAGGLRNQFVCYDPDNGLMWSSGPANRFGLGPFVLADGKFYVLSDDGELTVLRLADEYVELGKAKVLNGHDAWGPIAVVGKRMLMRDSKEMICIDAGA